MAVDGEVVRMCECPDPSCQEGNPCDGEADRVCPYCGLALCESCANEDDMCMACWLRKKYPPDEGSEPVRVVEAEGTCQCPECEHQRPATTKCSKCGIALCERCFSTGGMCMPCRDQARAEPEPAQVVDAEPQTSPEPTDRKEVPYLSEGAEQPTLVIYEDPDAGAEDSDNYSDCFVTEAFIRAIPEGIDLSIALYITEEEGGIAWGTTRHVRLDRTQLGKLIEFLTQHHQQLGE